ncbi:MAG: hypothetical protein V5A43_10175 [Haloarculaceae archaeon]
MCHPDPSARTRATVRAQSLARTLLVALLLSVGPPPSPPRVVPTGGGLGVAFLAGAAAGATVTVLRRRSGQLAPRRAGDRQTATPVLDAGA